MQIYQTRDSESPFVIYGSSVSALILAERLSSSKEHQVVLINPGSSFGGIFSGMNIQGRHFDIGMTNFEFELFGTPCSDLAQYSPLIRNDLVRFVDFVKAYFAQDFSFHEVPEPKMYFQGQFYPDFLITNHIETLAQLPSALQERLLGEARSLVRSPSPLHASLKKSDPTALLSAHLNEVSRANHGETFHQLFVEPMCQKVLGISSMNLPGFFHRSSWVPLFYPETLLAALETGSNPLKRTVFHYPNASYFGAIVDRVLSKLRSRPKVRIFTNSRAKSLKFEESCFCIGLDREIFRSPNLAWCADLMSLAAATGVEVTARKENKADLDLVFASIDAESVSNKFSVLIDVDPEFPIYRVTNQNVCSKMTKEPSVGMIFEANSKNFEPFRKDPKLILEAALHRYGIDSRGVKSLAHKHVPRALAIPSKEDYEDFLRNKETIHARFPQLEMLGSASGFLSVTFNDHVIQALQLADKLLMRRDL